MSDSLRPHGLQHARLPCGEGNGAPLQHSCLEKSHGWRSLVGCSPWGHKELDTTERLHFHFSLSCIGEGNGNPLQCSCLENPRDGEPGGLPSMGSHRVGHDWSDLAAAILSSNFNFPGKSIPAYKMKWCSFRFSWAQSFELRILLEIPHIVENVNKE